MEIRHIINIIPLFSSPERTVLLWCCLVI